MSSSDSINGGAGTADIFNLRVTALNAALTVVPVITNTETISISNVTAAANIFALNLGSSSGVNTVEFKDVNAGGETAFINASTTAAISLNNADAALQNVNLGVSTARSGNGDAFSVTIANGSGSSTVNAGLQLVTSAAGFVTADTTFETANVTIAGAANFVQFGTSLAGLTTLNISGAGTNTTANSFGLTLTEAANFASLKTINVSGVTAGGTSISTTGAADVVYTGSAVNDRLVFTGGVANLTTNDKLDFGTGTDTLGFGTNTAIANYTAAQILAINNLTTVERLEFTAAALTSLKSNDFTVNDFRLSGGNTTTATTLAITGVETADSFTVAGSHAAAAAAVQAGNTAGTNGLDAITFAGAAVAQTANLLLDGGRSITGMAGQAISTDTTARAAGIGGDAIDFGTNITKLVINSTGTTANSITGGSGGTAVVTNGTGGAGGVAIANGTQVQTVDITGSTALTIAGTAAATGTAANGAASGGFSGAVNINAAAFTAKLTVTGSTGNDVVTAGTGGTVFRGFGGQDVFTGGSGVDQYNLLTAADSNTAATASTFTTFTAGSDKFVVGAAPTAVKQGALYTAAGTGTLATDLASAITAGGAIAANDAVIVTITGTGAGTYMIVDTGGNGAYNNASTDVVVKLVGLVGTISTADFAVAIA